MERNQVSQDGMIGRLPAAAHLANPFVPFQMENPPKYESRKGLVRGTLFPGLDLPFMGLVNQKEKAMTPLSELQVMAFVLQELAMYLDTHREDQEALEMYHTYQKLYKDAAEEYTRTTTPMSHRIPTDGPYRWPDDPWPWEYAMNKEG